MAQSEMRATSFRRIFDDLDRLVEDVQRSLFGAAVLPAMRGPVETTPAPAMLPGVLGMVEAASWAPRIEVRDTGKEYVIAAELPGVDPKDVQIECTDEGITIRGETRAEETAEEGGVWRSERRYGSFFRLIPLPQDLVEADRARAGFRNGLLTIRLPKTEAAQQRVRRIQIVGAEPIGEGQAPATGSEPTGSAGGQAGEEGRRRTA